MIRGNEKSLWKYAVAASLVMHGALAVLIPSSVCQAIAPERIMNVRLTMAPAPQKVSVSSEKPKPETVRKEVPHPPRKTVQKTAEKPPKPTKPVEPMPSEISAIPAGTNDLPPAVQETGNVSGTATGVDGASSGSGTPVDVTTLQVTKKVIPAYPSFSRKRKEEGTVKIIVTIHHGKVTSAEIEESSGFERLDTSALSAIKQWRFNYKGTIRARIPVTFKLN